MCILALIIEEHPLIYEEYVVDTNYVEEASLTQFFELVMDYEENIKTMVFRSRRNFTT